MRILDYIMIGWSLNFRDLPVFTSPELRWYKCVWSCLKHLPGPIGCIYKRAHGVINSSNLSFPLSEMFMMKMREWHTHSPPYHLHIINMRSWQLCHGFTPIELPFQIKMTKTHSFCFPFLLLYSCANNQKIQCSREGGCLPVQHAVKHSY